MKMKMKLLHIIFIFLLLSIGIKAQTQIILNFKVIYYYQYFYYIIRYDYLYFYNTGNDQIFVLHRFVENEGFTTEEESEMISLGRFKYNSESQCLLIIKNYIYSLSNEVYNCNTMINGIEGYLSQVIPFKCTDLLCFYIIGFVDSNKLLYLDLYEKPLSSCEPNNKLSSLFLSDIASDNINCQIMNSDSHGEVLTCFYRNNNSKNIIVESFSIDMINKELESITSLNSFKETNGPKIIKAILSEDETRAYVCFINDDNNCDCLVYNINTNEWSNYFTYLNSCLSKLSSLFFDYYDITNEYFLYCFESRSEINLIKLNENFKIISIDDNNIYDGIKDCSDYFYSSLIYNSTKIIIFKNCDNIINIYNIGEYQYIIPTTTIASIKKTILTTFPTTTIKTIKLTTNKKEESTTISSAIIRTTEPNDIQSKIATTNIISTLIQKLNPTTIIKSSLSKYSSFLPSTMIRENELIVIQEKSNKTKEEIIENLNEVMKDYDIWKIYEIFGDDYNIKISPINSNLYKNISTYIDFSNCENILRDSYGLSPSSILTVYQLEIDNTNEQSLINNVEYAVFDENKRKLDLSVCKDEIIEINYQLNTSMINMSKVNYYAELGIDIFNIEHEFFNDICYSYSEKGSDMILKDRISDIYENYSVCENNCQYEKVDLTRNTVTCKCTVKTNVDSVTEPPNLFKIIRDSFKDSNVAVIKCYNLVFSIKNKLQNIGFWLFTFLIFLHIPFYIHYMMFNINSIKKYIYNEMEKFNYIYKVFNPIKKGRNKKNNYNIRVQDSKESILKRITFKKSELSENYSNEINLSKNKKKIRKKKLKKSSKFKLNTSIKGYKPKSFKYKLRNNMTIENFVKYSIYVY